MANIEETPTSYSTESQVDETVVAAERPVLSVSGAAVGRRKEAVARVRVVPGSGKWTINGLALDFASLGGVRARHNSAAFLIERRCS